MDEMSVSEEIVELVLHELRGRKGFGGWWDRIDPDIRKEIVETLAGKIDKYLEEYLEEIILLAEHGPIV